MSENKQKQVIYYDPRRQIQVSFGVPGYVVLAHQGEVTRTDIVTRIEPSGEFETRDAIYRPMTQEQVAA